jgi:hypothetical protein
MKKFTVLMVLLFVSMTCIMAQTIADYIYSTTTDGSLMDMSSGTTSLLTGFKVSAVSAVTNIGFTFKLGATTYTQFSVNSNGQMRLGATVITELGAEPNLDLALLAPMVEYNVLQSTGKIHYKLVGSSPNQKLIVEWKNLYIPYAYDSSTGTFSTFQAILYETTNKVEYIYGTMWNNKNTSISRGVCLSTSNVYGSVGNIIGIADSPIWNVTETHLTVSSFAASSAMNNLNSSADGSRRVFSFLPPSAAAVPNAAISPSPANNATGISLNPVLTWASGGGIPTDYDVYFGTVAAGLPGTANANVPNPTWTPTGPLLYNTAYTWKIVPHNANGYCATGINTWTFTTAGSTVTGFPYEIGFENAGALPANWTATEAVAGATYHWAATTADALHSASSPHSGTYFAYLNSYNANTTYNPYYLNSPPIALDATAKRLSYWYYIGADSGDTPLSVEISSDNISWTSLYTHNAPSNTGAWHLNALSLGTYASSTVYIRFSGFSNFGYDQCNLAIDDVKVEDIPTLPIFALNPDVSNWDFGQTVINSAASKQFTITNTGTGTLNLSSVVASGTYYSLSVAPTDMTLTACESTSFTVQYLPTAVGVDHLATLVITDGRAVTTVSLSGSCADPTVAVFPYTESFDTVSAPAMPLGWSVIDNNADGDKWITSTSNPRTGVNCARIYTGNNAANDDYLLTPPIVLTGNQRLKFWARSEHNIEEDEISVLLSTTTPTVAAFTNVLMASTSLNFTTYTEYTVDLCAYTGTCYVSFTRKDVPADGWYLYLDDVLVEDLPAAPIFSYSPTSIYFGEATQAVQLGPQNVTITNTGDAILNIAATDISLIGINAAQFSFGTSNLPAALGTGQSVVIPVYLTAATQYTISATLRIVNSQSRTDYDVALNAWGLPTNIVIIGNGDIDLNLPINPFFAYGYSQSIFLQSEISRADQRIEKLYYYRTGSSEITSSSDWTIYMGHTALTAFDTTSSWIPLAGLSQVFTGTVPLPAISGWLEITLDVPFVYNNTDNLVIAVDENAAGYNSSYGPFFDSTASATNRSINAYSDNANPDPAAPPAGTLKPGYPNVMFRLGEIPVGEPEAVSLSAPADGAIGVPKAGFEFTWIPSLTGGIPTSYVVYMATDEDSIFEENSWVTTSYHFNPVTQGSFTFNYLDHYFWTVKAVNADGDATADPVRSFEIEADSTIPVTVFPYTMDFEANGDNSLPNRWTRSSLGVGWLFGDALWSDSFDIPDHTVYAAANDDAADDIAGGDDGSMDLLFGPHFDFSAGYAGIPILSFDSFYSGDYGQSATVEICSNGIDWTVLKTLAANPAWVTLSLGLADYDGMSDVQLRFHADDAGAWASGWAIDNFFIDYVTLDWMEPVVNHYPIIGVPLLNTDITVVADITDELTWNSGISSAALHYSLDGGAVVDVPMTGVGSRYSALIPGQAAGTLVAYYITAADASAQLNTLTTATWDFYIDSPVWLQYDSNTISTYLGPETGDFGIMTGFDNPFGAGNPCQINSVFARSLDAATGNIHVYTYDGGSDTFTDLMPSFAQSFLPDTDTVVPLTACVTTAGYFYVAITDVAGPNYFAMDQTQTYYPDTHYIIFDAGISTANLATVEGSGFAGSWLLRANVQAGSSGLDTPVLSIADGPTLAWDAVTGANSYRVYGSADPYAANPWTLLTTTGLLTYTNATLGNTHFFKVGATTDAPPTKNAAVTRLNKLIDNGSKRAAQTPKATIKLKNRN